MRTTLDIDNDVLQAAKEIAATRKQTAGQVLSDLARKGLATRQAPEQNRSEAVMKNGWYVLPHRGGVVTTELVNRLLDEADLEDAGLMKE